MLSFRKSLILKLLLLSAFCLSCQRSLYVDDLGEVPTFFRGDQVPLSTPTRIYMNPSGYIEGYHVTYSKKYISYQTSYAGGEFQFIPIEKVNKLEYRSRIGGLLAGFTAGFIFGQFVHHSVGLINGDSFSQNVPYSLANSARLGLAFALGGFMAGTPVTTYIKNRPQELLLLPYEPGEPLQPLLVPRSSLPDSLTSTPDTLKSESVPESDSLRINRW